MLLPLSYNHLASWIYYSFVFILRLLFINSWSQTFCLLKGFYLMYSSISFTCTSFVVAAFLPVLQKPTFSGCCFYFFQKFPRRTSHRLAQLMVFTKAGCIISPETESLTSLACALLEKLPHHLSLICLFSKDRFFACSWTPNTVCSIAAFLLNHVIWPVRFGSWDATTLPSASSVATLFWSLG